MRINKEFSQRQIELLENLKIDISTDYDINKLEDIEDLVYDAMIDNLDKNQDFTPLAEEYEGILDIIVKIENDLQ